MVETAMKVEAYIVRSCIYKINCRRKKWYNLVNLDGEKCGTLYILCFCSSTAVATTVATINNNNNIRRFVYGLLERQYKV